MLPLRWIPEFWTGWWKFIACIMAMRTAEPTFFGTGAKEIVAESRKTIADILKVDIVPTLFLHKRSTESNNMAIVGLLEYALETGRNHFITTAIEHKNLFWKQ